MKIWLEHDTNKTDKAILQIFNGRPRGRPAKADGQKATGAKRRGRPPKNARHGNRRAK